MHAEVREMPLFPLNVVLFPNQNLPLHIFEPRYRIMIKRCIDNKEPFGVVLAWTEANIANVGTACMISKVERLPDGRMDINTIGTQRFQVRDWQVSGDGYLIGSVVDYPFVNQILPETQLLATRVIQRMRRYLKLLAQDNGMSFQVDSFPTDSQQLAIFTAIALQIELDEKQELLEQASVTDLLHMEDAILKDEVKLLSVMAHVIKPPQDEHIFSRN